MTTWTRTTDAPRPLARLASRLRAALADPSPVGGREGLRAEAHRRDALWSREPEPPAVRAAAPQAAAAECKVAYPSSPRSSTAAT